jgi:hypothetical protein
MSRHAAIAIPLVALSAALVLAPARPSRAQSVQSTLNSSQPPTDADLRARGVTLVANQHKNDEALDQYERIEHELDTTGGANPRTLVDKKTRLVPNGAGTTKILVEENGHQVSPEDYRRGLQTWIGVLQFMVNPDDERAKYATAKYAKRAQTRAGLVDALLTAFTRKWVGREMMEGHDCDVIELTPDPNFHPHSLFESALPHANAKIWVDRNADQLVRAEAHITSDLWVGGGVLGKLYKGGVFVMEQTEVSPGIWLPVRYRFDFSGRKFLFTFEEHQSIDAANYHYIGGPKQALAVAQSELASGKGAGDP